MKKMMTATALLLLVFAHVPAQKGVSRVQVRADEVTAQPAGKSFVIDLTRGKRVYSIPANVDSSRVRVRTRTGEVVLGDMMKQMGMSGAVTVGTLSDMRALNFTRTGGSGGLSYDCSDPEVCTCKGFSDCLKMNLDDKCSTNGLLVCSKGFCACNKKK